MTSQATNPSPTPAFYISELRPSDAPALAASTTAAFEGEPMHEAWVAPVSPPSEREARLLEFRTAVLTYGAQNPQPGTFNLVARRVVNDEPVGWISWEAPTTGASVEAVQTSIDATKPEPPSAQTHPIVLQHVRASMKETFRAMRERIWGSATVSDFWMLDALAVDPAVQGQGVGRMLVEWGCARADAEGKAAYLESSEAALKLYRQAGFVEVTEDRDGVDGWMDFEYGGRRCAMIRRPKVRTEEAT